MEISAREVFDILVRECSRGLRAFLCSAVRRAEDAEDLYQETLVAAWKSLDRYDRSRPFAPWLRGIAMNVASDWMKSAARRRVLVCDEETLAQIGTHFSRLDGLAVDTWEEKTAALRDCLGELGGDERELVDLRYRDGVPCESIATRLGKQAEAIRKRLQRVRAQLAMCVEGKLATAGGAP
jgi:RNA polymerase sigma-70 factor (ECF subfamily)